MGTMEELVARWCSAPPVTSTVPGVLTVELSPGRSYDVSVRAIDDDEAALEGRWTASADLAADSGLLRDMAEGAAAMAAGLVRCEPTDTGVVISAPLYLENLGRQAFLSAVAQVARAQWLLETSAPAIEARQAAIRLIAEADPTVDGAEKARLEDAGRASVAKTAPAPSPTNGPPWSPTHVAPAGGLAAWSSPDPSAPPASRIEAGVELVVKEERDGWAHVAAWNGWTAWVDGRLLRLR